MPAWDDDEILNELNKVWTTLSSVAMWHREDSGLWATLDRVVCLIAMFDGRLRYPIEQFVEMPQMFGEYVAPLHPALAADGIRSVLRAIEILRKREGF